MEAEQFADEGSTGDVHIGSSRLPLGAEEGSTAPLDELDFDDGMVVLSWCFYVLKRFHLEDQTNLHRHAARNAHDAIILARERAQAFDVQAAIDRKANEALSRARVVDNDEEDAEGYLGTAGSMSTTAPIVDCEW